MEYRSCGELITDREVEPEMKWNVLERVIYTSAKEEGIEITEGAEDSYDGKSYFLDNGEDEVLAVLDSPREDSGGINYYPVRPQWISDFEENLNECLCQPLEDFMSLDE